MGGVCSNLHEETLKQEQFVRKNIKVFERQLKQKYSRPQIECKLRQLYNNSDISKNTFISNDHWRIAKRKCMNKN